MRFTTRQSVLLLVAAISLSASTSHAFITSSTTITTSYSNRGHCNYKHTSLSSHQHSNQHNYHQADNSGPLPLTSKLTESQIHILISKRLQYKRQRNYNDADKILNALNKCGIYIHDKRKEYRLDGKNHFGRSQQYVMRGSTYNLSNEDIEVISQMVEDRSYAKKKREYHRSDEISEKLKYKYNVKVDDKNREWSVVAVANMGRESDDISTSSFEEEYVPSPLAPPNHPTHTMSTELKLQISQILSKRSTYRQDKEYKMADDILNELFEKHSVVVDDRTKEWKVVDDTVAEEDDEFVKGAQLSQRSAFARQAGNSVRRDDTTSKDTTISTHDDDVILPYEQTEEVTYDLESLTVVELKQKLRQEGLPVSGKKADLISRLSNL